MNADKTAIGTGVVLVATLLVVGRFVVGQWAKAAARERLSDRPDPGRQKVLPGGLLGRLRSSGRRETYDAQLVRFVLSMGAALRAGNSVIAALDTASKPCDGQLRSELADLMGHVRQGWTVREAIQYWERATDRSAVRLVAGAMLLGGATGGRLADALDSVAATVATQLELDAERRALSSQARASAALLVLAPIGFSLIAAVIDPRVGRGLVATPIGLVSVLVAVGLDVLGWRWMSAIVRSAA